MRKINNHLFHIPVLGTGFSLDTPLKVAKYGISSVISLVDDGLMEQFREYYCKKEGGEFIPISEKEDDKRAKRITAYLNMVNELVNSQFDSLKDSDFSTGSDLSKYFEMLPENSEIKKAYLEMMNCNEEGAKINLQDWLRSKLIPGSIDVNIMTKVDKPNYDSSNNLLPNEYNDAHAALRGFANSTLNSTIVFSAGMNPRLYSYIESFTDFFPDANGDFKKRIAIKVSDYRSALIQGKFLAKKGIWVSEYRVESGLNCGGHAFATDGLLLGPIMEEFKKRKDELFSSVKEIYSQAIIQKNITTDENKLEMVVTVQGGVGTFEEQSYLLRNYGVTSVGWGTPFLLVPEVINVDDETLQRLAQATEDDLYLSHVSPLGVRFNNLRNSGKDNEKYEKAMAGKPGSSCPKRFLTFNNEFSSKHECTASITYLNKKITDLKGKFEGLDFKREYEKIIDKSCLCVGLGASALKANGIETPKHSQAVAICPGPNLAYFSKVVGLEEMVDHIYGRVNLISHPNRPNMFIKELNLYINYLAEKFEEEVQPFSKQTEEFLEKFHNNLSDGIEYYKSMIFVLEEESEKSKKVFLEELLRLEEKLALMLTPASQVLAC